MLLNLSKVHLLLILALSSSQIHSVVGIVTVMCVTSLILADPAGRVSEMTYDASLLTLKALDT